MNNLFYICACSPEEKGGIYLYRVTDSNELERLAFTRLEGANFLCFSPDRKYLYSTWNTEAGGGMAAYSVAPDGSLAFLNKLESLGRAACHATCSADGRYLYCANYATGSFAEFKLAKDGSLAKRTRLIEHHGSGPRKDRQECAHVHCTVLSPDGKFLCVNDLGTDSVMIYPLGANGLELPAKEWKAAPGDGPRHILFDKSGRFAYVINELGNSVTTLRYSNGELEKIGCYTTLPSDCSVKTKASAIRFSQDEKFLFASNRGFDSIACFRVVEPGKLELYDIVSSFGVSPRDINRLPGGALFAAANEFSDIVAFYDYDEATGKLNYKEGCDISDLPRPLYILF